MVVKMPSIPQERVSWVGSFPSENPIASVTSFSNRKSVYSMLWEWAWRYFWISWLPSSSRIVGGMWNANMFLKFSRMSL